MKTIKDLHLFSINTLKENNEILSPKKDAEILMCYVLNMSRPDLYLNYDREIDDLKIKEINEVINKRKSLIPVAYITKKIDFYDYEFMIEEGVFIPRKETEVLIDIVIKHLFFKNIYWFLDLGTGCGAILCSLLKIFKESYGIGIDKCLKALSIAQKNGEILKIDNRIKWVCSDWFNGINENIKFDCIVANPPYVASFSLLQKEVKEFEPLSALISKDSGLFDIKIILRELKRYLRKGGIFIAEIAEYNTDRILAMVRDDFSNYNIEKDLAGRDRFLKIIL
ncbi:MAG: peptide chain release factor N(5)-glutamine methyltransferase [Candidatus Hydrogenedentota bacterium]